MSINIENMQPGIYFITTATEGSVKAFKLVKNKN